MKPQLTPPFWYAVGSVVATPFTAMFMIFCGVALILAWPVIPFLCYFQRKQEISEL